MVVRQSAIVRQNFETSCRDKDILAECSAVCNELRAYSPRVRRTFREYSANAGGPELARKKVGELLAKAGEIARIRAGSRRMIVRHTKYPKWLPNVTNFSNENSRHLVW